MLARPRLLVSVLGLLLAARTATAAGPEVVASAGTTLGDGGAATSLAVLWPIEGRFSFGGALFADDLGTRLADLHDPNTGAVLGTVPYAHRLAFGGEWRAEMLLHESRRVRLLWGGGFGYARQERDRGGRFLDAVSGTAVTTGTTFLLKAARGHALGVALAIRRELVHRGGDPNRVTKWGAASLQWRWRGAPKD